MQLNGIPRFLCDEMLGRLGRYLRAVGYDTTLASGGEPDSRWLKQAIDEERYFLTRDRLVLEHRDAQGVVFLLPEGDLDHYASALASAFAIHWTAQAFPAAWWTTPSLSLPTTHNGRACPLAARINTSACWHALPAGVSIGRARITVACVNGCCTGRAGKLQ